MIWRQNSCFLSFFTIVAFCVTAGAEANNSGQGKDLKDAFLAEAPRQWTEYANFASQLHGTMEYVRKQDNVEARRVRFEYKNNERCRLYVAQPSIGTNLEGDAFGRNQVYAFHLQRKDSGQPWVIVNVEKHEAGKKSETYRELADSVTALCSCLHLHATASLPDLVKQPTFRVLKAGSVQAQGEELIQIDFDNSHALQENGRDFYPIQAGTLLLDAKRHWCLRACTLRVKFVNAEGYVKKTVEYQALANPFPIPKRSHEAREFTTSKGENQAATVEQVFTVSEPSSLPEDQEFTLSAFGLQEPPGVIWSKPTPWYLWAGGIAFVCLILGFLCKRFARRAAAAA